MGSAMIEALSDYLLDSLQDVFARENAALVLGMIGNRTVVERLAVKGKRRTPYDTKFVVYALGCTGNLRAVDTIRTLARNVAAGDQSIVTQALAHLGYVGEPFRAQRRRDNAPRRSDLSPSEVIDRHCPDLESRWLSQYLFSLYQRHGRAALDNAFAAMGWPQDLRKLCLAAQTLREMGQLWEAEILFTEALDRYPMIDQIYHLVGDVYWRQRRNLAARRYYAVALMLRPSYANFYNDFALVMQELGNREAARFLLVLAISLDYDNYKPWFNLANLYLRWQTGSQIPRRDVALKDGGLIRFFAVSHVKEALLRDARICLQHVLYLNPQHPTARQTLERVCEATGASLDGRPTARELMTTLHIEEGEPGPTFDAPERSPETAEAFERSTRLRYRGDFEGALQAIEEANRMHPGCFEIITTIALLQEATGRLHEAIKTLEAAVARRPADRRLLMNYSAVLAKAGQSREAIQAAQRAIEVAPNAEESWIVLTMAYIAAGNTSAARDALTEDLRRSPPYSWPLMQAASLCEELGISEGVVW